MVEERGAHEDARAVRIARGRGAEEAVPRALLRVRVRVGVGIGEPMRRCLVPCERGLGLGLG